MVTDVHGIITYLNPSSKDFLGYHATELVNKKVMFAYDKDLKKVKNKFNLPEERGTNFEYRIVDKLGNLKWVSHSWVPIIRDNGVKMIVSVVRDITKKKEAERERENLLNEITDKNKDLEQIIYMITHDLRTPMTNIQGFTKAIEYSLEKIIKDLESLNIPRETNEDIENILQNEIKEFRKYIHQSIYKIDSLIKGLVEITQVGRDAINIKRIDMNRLISDVISNFRYELDSKNIDINTEELPDCIGDRVQINQVFTNLIDNAIKFMTDSRKGLISITGGKKGENSIYCVKDNGIGINNKYFGDVFEMFWKMDLSDDRGQGLGLAIINRILTRNKGKIWIESDEGAGSRFYISLPS
jgi:PAS domain S-box-containing protein